MRPHDKYVCCLSVALFICPSLRPSVSISVCPIFLSVSVRVCQEQCMANEVPSACKYSRLRSAPVFHTHILYIHLNVWMCGVRVWVPYERVVWGACVGAIWSSIVWGASVGAIWTSSVGCVYVDAHLHHSTNHTSALLTTIYYTFTPLEQTQIIHRRCHGINILITANDKRGSLTWIREKNFSHTKKMRWKMNIHRNNNFIPTCSSIKI